MNKLSEAFLILVAVFLTIAWKNFVTVSTLIFRDSFCVRPYFF